jgi:hypothetical protein
MDEMLQKSLKKKWDDKTKKHFEKELSKMRRMNPQAPDFGIAPLGDDLQDATAAPAAPAVDLTQFSLAPVGSDMGELARTPAGPAPDTSHLKLLE